ncbi:unnamed protein product [Cyprideis torosa]|uniref:Uncharacterized protein n=1 Tax=Cyprideis torosa TaxID=163714 RepID=A0A7R8W7Q8_9CRUS|nr:unnamed protein product [Cyprideis torosa]CAG0885437.1 unnamed protein product [Cyprideis torosa]
MTLLGTPNGILKFIELIFDCVILGLYVAEPNLFLSGVRWDILYMLVFGGYIFIIFGFLIAYGVGTKTKLPELLHSFVGGCLFFVCGVSILYYATRIPENLQASGFGFSLPNLINNRTRTFNIVFFAAICLGCYVEQRIGLVFGITGNINPNPGNDVDDVLGISNISINLSWDRLYLVVFGGFILIISGYLIAYGYGIKTLLPEVFHSICGAIFYLTCGVSILVLINRPPFNGLNGLTLSIITGAFSIIQTVTFFIDTVFAFTSNGTSQLSPGV